MKINQHILMMTFVLILLLSFTIQLPIRKPVKNLPSNNLLTTSTPKESLNKTLNKSLDFNHMEKNEKESHAKPKESSIQTQAKQEQNYTNTQTMLIYKETPYLPFNKTQIMDLTNYIIDCSEANSAINSLSLKINSNINGEVLGYKYTCVKSLSIKTTCVSKSTIKSQIVDSKFSLGALVKIYPLCESGTVMSKLALKTQKETASYQKNQLNSNKRKSSLKSEVYIPTYVVVSVDFLWYEYTCCEADVAEEKNFENQKTFNLDMSYMNLLSQSLNARDFNAISSFNLLIPEGSMYYSGKVSVLKGETSPYFPSVTITNQQNRVTKSITNGTSNKIGTSTNLNNSKDSNSGNIELMRTSSETKLKKSGEKSFTTNEYSGSNQSRIFAGYIVYRNPVDSNPI